MSRLREKQILVVDAASIVARAAHRIDHPSRWTKRHWALDGRGRVVRIDDPRAARFCLVGAVLRAEHELYGREIAYTDSPRANGGPMADSPRPSTRLALGLLACLARLELKERGLRMHVAAGDEPGEGRPAIHLLDLPVIFNGVAGVGQSDCLAMLVGVGSQLFLLNDTPKLLDLLIVDERLGDSSQPPAAERPDADSTDAPE